MRLFLFRYGLRYRKNDKRYPGKPDIVLPKYNTIIFINGCFWHMHENCRIWKIPKSNTEFWEKKLNKNKERDIENIVKLKRLGWNVITIWECEVRNNEIFDSFMYNIIEQIKSYKNIKSR